MYDEMSDDQLREQLRLLDEIATSGHQPYWRVSALINISLLSFAAADRQDTELIQTCAKAILKVARRDSSKEVRDWARYIINFNAGRATKEDASVHARAS